MGDYTELKRLAARVLTDRRFCGDENHKALADGVLALIAENERLESEAVYSAAGFDAAREEISKLRAEVAGLHTGYEAYERVNAELKAEVEGLRHGLSLVRHWGASALKAALVDSQPSELLDIACLLRHQASDIDAALGQGEQS